MIDDDGEVYEIQEVRWANGELYWKFLVPSTGYILTHTTKRFEGEMLIIDWSNQYGSGEEEFRRVE